jgi:hypothetical protein
MHARLRQCIQCIRADCLIVTQGLDEQLATLHDRRVEPLGLMITTVANNIEKVLTHL